MKFLRNLLVLVGIAAIAAAAYFGPGLWKYKVAFDGFDPKAKAMYMEMADLLVETGNSAAATVWKVKVADGLTAEEVGQSIQTIADERNIRSVGFLPLGDQVTAMNGEDWRTLNIYLYCNPLTAAKMVEFDPAFAAYLPCRVSLVEDENGELWIYTLNMDLMIYGGETLPEALLLEALEVKETMLQILNRAAEGDF